MQRKYSNLIFKSIVCLIFIFFLNKHIGIKLKSETSFDQSKTKKLVRTFKLDEQLLPEGVYSEIKCVNSKKIEVRTLLCLHDLDRDTWVSRDIVEKGIWEKKTIGKD